MTYRSKVKARLAGIGVMKERAKLGLAVSLTYYLASGILGLFIDLSALESSPWLIVLHIPTPVLLISLYYLIKSSRLLRVHEPCPKCGKDLSYLLTDRNYSHCGLLRIPVDFPKKFDKCPYCSQSWDEEEPQNKALQATAESRGDAASIGP